MAKCRSRQRIDVIIPSGATHFRAFPCGERQANGGTDSPVSKSVLSYFETSVSGGILARAVQDSSFQNMKRWRRRLHSKNRGYIPATVHQRFAEGWSVAFAKT
jgi:hypothetical protein